MKIFELTQEQYLNVPISTAWDFFSNPNNLNRITPDFMKFKITSQPEMRMYTNQIIVYKIGLFPFIYSTWVTEIKSVVEGKYFIDEQKFGPYKMWHHRHLLEETDTGIKMTDKIIYALPFGILGVIVHKLFIRKRLDKIFSYRFRILDSIFNSNDNKGTNPPE